MTHAEWLEGREPAAPAGLQAQLQQLFGDHPEWDALPRAEAFVKASEFLLERVLRAESSARCVAMDLLAADACVTYGFEAAAGEPGTIGGLAEGAMERIAYGVRRGSSVVRRDERREA